MTLSETVAIKFTQSGRCRRLCLGLGHDLLSTSFFFCHVSEKKRRKGHTWHRFQRTNTILQYIIFCFWKTKCVLFKYRNFDPLPLTSNTSTEERERALPWERYFPIHCSHCRHQLPPLSTKGELKHHRRLTSIRRYYTSLAFSLRQNPSLLAKEWRVLQNITPSTRKKGNCTVGSKLFFITAWQAAYTI